MKTQTINLSNHSEQNRLEMVDFYNEATEDYEFWSKDYNMHFGYFIPFKTNPFKRDSMLNEIDTTQLPLPWFPDYEFLGQEYTASDVTVRDRIMMAHRVGDPLEDDPSSLDPGENNQS